MTAGNPHARHGAADGTHRLALALLVGSLATAVAMLALLVVVADQPDSATGDLFVIFPPATGETAVLRATAASYGVVRRRGLLGGGWELTASSQGFAGRLRQHGALLVLPTSPFQSLGLAGCSFMPWEAYRRPDLAKLRAGPM
jgi:hypothetical protein